MNSLSDETNSGGTVAESVKRLLIGPPIPTRRLARTLLPKVLALPVFSSDALSSVAYATEQMLIVLIAASAGAISLVIPIAGAVSVLMTIVVISYRQTVRGYPHGGGAYTVAKHNLGTIPGLVAAAALLTDYVLTVTVSVAAGAFAVTSAIPQAGPLKVELSLGLIALMTAANLRGLRESGIVFAIPTYAFVASILGMSVTGLVKCIGGCPVASVPEAITPGTSAVGIFVILHAFSSGSTALTGVEAISNGVPAFRPPSARNAATVLATMGAIAIAMFLSVSWLAVHTGARPSHDVSVVAQVARAVFGSGIGFYAVQITTAAILVVAANTAFQDFPRLSSILARDRFLPHPFQNRGDRLVFSNGVMVLALIASALVIAFGANVSRLIQLYVVGVFTAFTLSQSGMVIHWHRSSDPGRRRSMVINAVGAATTGLVLVVITVTKFEEGAWMVVLAVPLLVAGLLAIRRHILATHVRLTRGGEEVVRIPPDLCVLIADHLGPEIASSWRYLRALDPERLEAVYVGRETDEELHRAASMIGDVPLRAAEDRSPGGLAERLSSMVGNDGFLTVAVPALHQRRRHSFGTGAIARIARAMRADSRVVLTQMPAIAGPVEPIPQHVVALVIATQVANPEVNALNYARSLQPAEIRAIHVALDPEGEQEDIRDEWARHGFEPPLQIVDAPLRHLGPPLIEEVRRITNRPDTLVVVIVPIVVRRHRGGPLGHRQARYIEGLFLHARRVMVAEVPYELPDGA